MARHLAALIELEEEMDYTAENLIYVDFTLK